MNDLTGITRVNKTIPGKPEDKINQAIIVVSLRVLFAVSIQ